MRIRSSIFGATVAVFLGGACIPLCGEDGVKPEEPVSIVSLEKAAEAGDAAAQTRLGRIYGNGEGVPRDGYKAFYWFSKAAAQDDPEGLSGLSKCYLLGIGVEQNSEKFLYYAEKAASLGSVKAKRDLGVAYISGVGGVEVDREKGMRILKVVAETGDPEAMGIYGGLLAILPTASGESAVENKIRGEKYILEAAKLGDLNSQKNLGILYSRGGVQIEKDRGKSLEWFAKAARQGDFIAKENFCRIFFLGMTVPEIVSCTAEPYATNRELFEWLNEVEKGKADMLPSQAVRFSEDDKSIAPKERVMKKSTANALLSIFYSHGIGTEKDMERAKEFLERSLVSDDMLALFTAFRAINESKNLREYPGDKVIAETERILLLMLYMDKGNEMDQDEIVSLLAQFYMALHIMRGDAWAEEMAITFAFRMNDENPIKWRLLGVCYSDGYGVECDKAKAHEYWQRGIEKNDYEAMSLLGISYFNDGDKESALKLLNEAAMHGNDLGKSYLDAIDKLSKEKPRE